MIAFGLMAVALASPLAPVVTGDFDGDGRPDSATIVRRTDGSRDVIATFHDGRQQLVLARVDAQAVLGVIPPAEIARLCTPFARAVPECTRQLAQRDRDGLSFRRTAAEVPALALWTGQRFALQFSTWQPRPRQ